MDNIIDYAKYIKDKTFSEKPFNDIDALIFAELAYVNFSLVTEGDNFVTLDKMGIKSERQFYAGSYDALNNKKLINTIRHTRRYKRVQVGNCHMIDDVVNKTQFFAATFILPTGEGYITYRGTDTSINGIKEDLLVAYQDYIPGALPAIEYLNKTIKLFDGNFYIGGHSKGGNLALFAALNLNKRTTKRLVKAYSFDGPGFQKELDTFPNYQDAMPKIRKYITGNDMIGVIYNKVHTAKIVYSRGLLLGGHDLFSWSVNIYRQDFKYVKDRSFISKSHEEALTKWLEDSTPREKQLAVEILSELLGECKTPFELLNKGITNLNNTKSKWGTYTVEERQKTKETYLKLIKYYLSAYSPKSFFEQRKAAKEAEEKRLALTKASKK